MPGPALRRERVATFIGAGERVAYTVEHRGRCLLVTGPVPAAALQGLANMAPAGSIIDSGVAERLGATLAIGLESELQALRK